MVLDNNLEKFYNYISSEKGYSQNTLMACSNDLKLFADYLDLCVTSSRYERLFVVNVAISMF